MYAWYLDVDKVIVRLGGLWRNIMIDKVAGLELDREPLRPGAPLVEIIVLKCMEILCV